jgi:23S rRNA (pseudouridine1915-N3)-methyltransferase
MHLRLLAVGDRQPRWVNSAFDEYVLRLPRTWQFHLEAIGTVRRNKGASTVVTKNAEGTKILAKLKPAEYAVVLDERGKQFTSQEFAGKLGEWQAYGADIAFIIGGPDGVSTEIHERANLCWSLSKLTLPHGMVRVMFAEQIYRAWSLSTGHPYHRE